MNREDQFLKALLEKRQKQFENEITEWFQPNPVPLEIKTIFLEDRYTVILLNKGIIDLSYASKRLRQSNDKIRKIVQRIKQEELKRSKLVKVRQFVEELLQNHNFDEDFGEAPEQPDDIEESLYELVHKVVEEHKRRM